MSLDAAETGGRVFAANTVVGVYEAQENRTYIAGNEETESEDLLTCMLVDLHHWADAQGIDFGIIEGEAADMYRGHKGGRSYA